MLVVYGFIAPKKSPGITWTNTHAILGMMLFLRPMVKLYCYGAAEAMPNGHCKGPIWS
jgi:hypothetical protein